MSSSNNISFFLERFKEYGENTAMIWHDSSYSYSNLLERITNWRPKLKDIPSGSIVGLESDFSPETIAILFVLIESNTIVVPLDINHSSKNTKKLEIAQLD
jgi:hypothetical protein